MATASTPGGGTVNVDMQGGVTGSGTGSEGGGPGPSVSSGREDGVNTEPNVMPGYVEMPAPTFINYDPITRAPYKMTNIKKFAQRWGTINRNEILKNYQLADQLALNQIDTELKGLQSYVPAAAALKRSETAADNIFNQAQRLAQVNQALPEVYGQLQAQAARAESFASGRMPSDIEDRALELGIRSQAADYASAGGFGATSSVARKASDLLSAQQRIGLSQYGDQLLNQNIATKANLYLAPTEYANVGSQINVMPSISGSQLASTNLANINQSTMITASTALGAKIGEKQFVTGLEQRTREFNATNELATDQFNASTANQFALTKFAYDVGYEGTEAGVATANNNWANQVALMDRYQAVVQDYIGHAQDAGTISDIASGITEIITAAAGGGGDFVSGIGNALGFKNAGSAMYSSQGAISDGSYAADTAQVSAGAAPTLKSAAMPDAAVTSAPSIAPNGGTITVQSSTPSGEAAAPGYSAPIQSFADSTGITLPQDVGSNQVVTRELIRGSNVVLNTAGISITPIPGMQYIGANYSGGATYVAPKLLAMSDTNAGQAIMGINGSILDSLGALDGADIEKFASLSEKTSDTELLSSLDSAAANGDFNAFAEELLTATDKPTLDAVEKNKNVEGLTAAYSAHQLFQNWGSISPTQKSLAIAAMSLQNVTDSKGKKITDKDVPATNDTGYASLKVGDALNLVQQGYNAASLASNWELNNDIHKLAGGHSEPEDVAALSQGMSLLGRGREGRTVGDVSVKKLAGTGWSASPHVGVGAITGDEAAAVPGGYTQVAKSKGRRIAVPNGSIPTVPSGETSGSLMNSEAGKGGISDTAQTVYKGWTEAHTRKANNGVIGGSSMVSGLYGMSRTNPILFSSTIASTFVNPSKNIKYSNDADYFNYLGSVSLGRLLEGEKDPKNFEAIFKSASKVAKGKKLDEASFVNVASTFRAEFSKAGIKSKADAYGLANQAFAENRINAADLVGMQKVFNAIYDDGGFNTAKKLLAGRERGIELAKSKGRSTGLPKLQKLQKLNKLNKQPKLATRTKDDIRASNRQRYQIQVQAQGIAA